MARLKGDVQKRKDPQISLPGASTSSSSGNNNSTGQPISKMNEQAEEAQSVVKQPLLPHPDLKEETSRPEPRHDRRGDENLSGRGSVSTEIRRPPLLSTPG